ncbi:MAG: DNA polymerase III subunit delta [Phycisphaeraceae bacterium]|nr:DNA polymerase III subunit delta [Phycisphaeraceae bacterium]
MMRRQTLEELTDVVEAAHGELETLEFDGNRAELADVLDELRTFSLMQRYKIVRVNHAEEFVKNHRQPLERYAEDPVDNATLVFVADTWRKGNLDKAIVKVGGIVDCKPPDEDETIRWVRDRAPREHGCEIEPAAARQLVTQLGVDRMRIDQELAKLALMAESGQSIDTAMVTEAVGQTSEEKAWELQADLLAAMHAAAEGRQQVSDRPLLRIEELIELAHENDVGVLYFAVDTMRKIDRAAALLADGLNPNDVARELKLWQSRKTHTLALARRLGRRVTRQLFDLAMKADARAKSGLGDGRANVERLCLLAIDRCRHH